MIGTETLGVKCPRCDVEMNSSSAPAQIIAKVVGYMPPGISLNETVFYSVCPVCAGMILPEKFDPGQEKEVCEIK